jgi:hypothetical protein
MTSDLIRELQTKHSYKLTVAERETTVLRKNIFKVPDAGTRFKNNRNTVKSSTVGIPLRY